MVVSDVYVFLALFLYSCVLGLVVCRNIYFIYLLPVSLPAFGGEVRGDSHVQ